MRKIRFLLLSFFLLLFISSYSQRKSDIGLLGGASYYMGDINHSMPFYNPAIAGGLLIRYNINPRYVIKGSFSYLPVSANDLDASDFYQINRAAKFSNTVYDFAAQFEFNFLPYKFIEQKIGFSPFLSAGAGVCYTSNMQLGKNFWPTLPFGLGIKFTFGKYLSAGWEWNFRKLFDDKFDGVENIGTNQYSSFFHNNDWYSYSGIFLSYKLFSIDGTCPAYEVIK